MSYLSSYARGFLAFIAAALCLSTAIAQTANLARNEKATEQAIAATLLTDIFKRAGLTAKIEPLPAARANFMAISGEKDGEVGRVLAYTVKNPTLMKVEPPYYYLTTTAFAKSSKGISINSKDDLKKYRVGIVRGIAHAEAATAGVPDLQVVSEYDQMYKMLEADRIDVVVDSGVNGPYVVKKLGLKNISAVAELGRQDLYAILNPSKKEWAPKIEAVIKSLKSSGELAKMTARIEEEFNKSGIAP